MGGLRSYALRKVSRATIVLAAILVASLLPSAPASALIVDGGFESGVLLGPDLPPMDSSVGNWTRRDDNAYLASAPEPVHAGLRSAAVDTRNSTIGSFVIQDFFSGTSSYRWTFWVHPVVGINGASIAYNWDRGVAGFREQGTGLGFTPSVVGFLGWNSPPASFPPLTPNAWHEIQVVANRCTLVQELFVDGVLQGSVQATGTAPSGTATTSFGDGAYFANHGLYYYDDFAFVPFECEEQNSPPTITSFSAFPASEGQPVTFNALAIDPDGDALSFDYDFDGDGSFDLLGAGPTASHVFGDDFTSTASLRVTDGHSETTAVTSVTVTNVAPSIVLTIPESAIESQTITFLANVTDPGSDDITVVWIGPCAGWTPTSWYPNDPSVAPDPDPSPSTNPRAISEPQLVRCGDDGDYEVEVLASDDDGGITAYGLGFAVANAPPEITVSPAPALGVEGSLATLAANASDPGTDDLTFVWTWSLGPTVQHTYFNNGTTPDLPGSPEGGAPMLARDASSHGYGDDCLCSVTLVVNDDEGAWARYLTTIEIGNLPPTISRLSIPAGPFAVNENVEVPVSVFDPGSDDLLLTWSWGDGTSNETRAEYFNGLSADPEVSPDPGPAQGDATPEHRFAAPGVYHVTIEVSDDDGLVARREFTVTIQALSVNIAVSTNLKPMVASVFAATLAAVGTWAARRSPWRGLPGAVAQAKTLAAIGLPFVAAEVTTGVVSHLTGLLSIPPLVGPGLFVDVAILTLGLLVEVLWGLRGTADRTTPIDRRSGSQDFGAGAGRPPP